MYESKSAARRHIISLKVSHRHRYSTESDLVAGTFFPIICSLVQNICNEDCRGTPVISCMIVKYFPTTGNVVVAVDFGVGKCRLFTVKSHL